MQPIGYHFDLGRRLAPFTEVDRDRLYGRDREIASLVEHVLFRRAVVYTAPSGTGKTSLLRAGLVPRLAALGVATVYVACHGREPPDLARAIGPDGETPAAAAALRITRESKRLVVIVDQVEAAITHPAFAGALRDLEAAAAELEIGIVLSVRDDVLASLLAQLAGASNVLRLGPLTPAGAREAIIGPLIERRITIEEPLLAALLADLERAASLLATEMRWAAERAIYPPHLQLACSALYDQLGSGEEALAVRHYQEVGGLDEIVRDYLDRVLETELPAELVASARRVLLALVESDRTRAVRTDGELAERLPSEVRLAPVLEALRQRGVIVPLRAASGQPAWELVHDSLVPRVLAWSDRQDLARQRALDIVRHHLRGSRGERPSLLGAAELRELEGHAAAIDDLEREWAKRGAVRWSPKALVNRSQRAIRRRWLAIFASVAVALSIAGFLALRWFAEHQQRQQEALLSKADLGMFILELRAFDWNPTTLAPIYVQPTHVVWELFEPASEDELAAGDTPLVVTRSPAASVDPLARAWKVEAHGGKAVLVVSRPGCRPSVVPLARLPGYAQRDRPPTVRVLVPTCAATRRGMIEIAAGPYVSGGSGVPLIAAIEGIAIEDLPPERIVDLRTFAMDRTEVPNAAFRMFTSSAQSSAVSMPAYPGLRELRGADKPDAPVTQVVWSQARAYCSFMGKVLPSDEQWEKAMRGGLDVRGRPNSNPRRTVPWGLPGTIEANLKDTGEQASASIGATPGDRSPYGILDLGGNVQEWTRSEAQPGFYLTRGCSWGMCTSDTVSTVLALPNMRASTFRSFDLGLRCVAE